MGDLVTCTNAGMGVFDKLCLSLVVALCMVICLLGGYWRGKLHAMEAELGDALDQLQEMFPNLRTGDRQ